MRGKLSFVVFEEGSKAEKFLLRDAVAELKGTLIGEHIWAEYKAWPIYVKIFRQPWPSAASYTSYSTISQLTGQLGKPEAYYFPPQVNNYGGDFPFTFFGLEPGTTREQVRRCLINFKNGDNKITNISKAYRLKVGTGWDVPPGVLHARGSLCTYEPQKASDVFAMYQYRLRQRQSCRKNCCGKTLR